MHPKNIVPTVIVVVLIALLALSSIVVAQDTEDEEPLNTVAIDGSVIYFAEENGEATRFDRNTLGISRFGGLLQQQGAQTFSLEWNSGIPDEADLLIIPGPTDSLNPDQVARLWLYINNGGRVLIAADGFNSDANNGRLDGTNDALQANDGFFELAFPDFGFQPSGTVLVAERSTFEPAELTINTDTAADADDEEDGESESAETLSQPEPVQDNPLLPPFVYESTTGSIDADHPITTDLTGPLFFSGARPIEVDQNTEGLILSPLVFSTSQFYGETNFRDYFRDGVFAYNIGEDQPPSERPIVIALDVEASGARVVLFGDVDMLANSGGFQSSPSYTSNFVYPDNVQLALNSVAWLLESDNPTLTFNPPGPTATPTIFPTLTPTPTPEPESEGEG